MEFMICGKFTIVLHKFCKCVNRIFFIMYKTKKVSARLPMGDLKDMHVLSLGETQFVHSSIDWLFVSISICIYYL